MPRSYARRRPYRGKRRRRYRTKYRGRRRNYKQTVPRASLLGNRKMVKLKYHDNIVLDPSVLTSATAVFSANGMFDPNISLTGHQPRGFDQLMPLFDHYTVVGSKCTATFLPTDNIEGFPSSNALVCAIALRDVAAVMTLNTDILEDRNVTFRGMSGFRAGNPTRVTRKFSARRFLNYPSPLSAHDLRGTQSSNPSEQAYYHVSAIPLINLADLGAVQVSIDIMFIAVLSEPRLPLVS